MPIYFNSQLLPPFPNPEYAAWIDVMGIQSAMSRSLHISGNFVFKLHVAALQAPRANVRLYPVMDGMYICSSAQADMLDFLRSVLEQVADTFITESEPLHRFSVRGALAYGPVIHGNQIPSSASNAFQNNVTHKDGIILGLPVVQAHENEKLAPPFGIFIHESARAFAPAGTAPMKHVWWKWVNPTSQHLWQTTAQSIATHYDWC